MKKRITRGVSLAIGVGLVVSGGAAMAGGTSPAVAIKFKSGKDSPFAATRFDGAVVDKKMYILGFRAGDDTTDGSVWYYDIAKGKYVDTKTDMPVPISNYKVAILADSTGVGLYTFGGRDANGKILKTVQVYYPKTNKAKVLSSDSWPGTTPSKCVSLPGTGVAVVDNTAYVMGGMSFSTSVPACQDDNSKQVWSFDPKGKSGKKWTSEPDLNKARGYISPAVVGSTIYASGGDVNEAATLTAQQTVEAWKTGSKAWDDKGIADLKLPCDETQAFGFDSGPLADTVTLAGCGQWPNAVADVQQYDVKKDKWATVGQLLEARRNHAAANIGTPTKPQIMVLGGYNTDATAVLMTSEIGTPGGAPGFTATDRAHGVTAGGRIPAL